MKRIANRALLTIAATLLNDIDVEHLSNHADSVTIYLRERSRERSRVMYLYHNKCGSDDDLCQSYPFLISIINLRSSISKKLLIKLCNNLFTQEVTSDIVISYECISGSCDDLWECFPLTISIKNGNVQS